MLLGLIVDLRRLPSLRDPRPGDDFAPAASSRVSFSVLTGEISREGEVADPRRSSSDSDVRKKVVGPAALDIAACSPVLLLLDSEVLGRMTKPFQRAHLDKRYNHGQDR